MSFCLLRAPVNGLSFAWIFTLHNCFRKARHSIKWSEECTAYVHGNPQTRSGSGNIKRLLVFYLSDMAFVNMTSQLVPFHFKLNKLLLPISNLYFRSSLKKADKAVLLLLFLRVNHTFIYLLKEFRLVT